MKHYIIYGLKNTKGKVYYIGCTTNVSKRIKQHLYASFHVKTKMYQSIKKEGHFIDYIIIDEIHTDLLHEANCLEAFWILKYKYKRTKLLNKNMPKAKVSEILIGLSNSLNITNKAKYVL